MVRRIDENNIDLEIKELHSYPVKHIIASVENSKKEAEVEALKIRLNGKKAFIQNGLMGKYEVLSSETKPELRELTADFKEIGTGIYRLANPEWDKGSLWSIYSMDNDGSIVVSRMEDEEEESREALVSELQVKSNVSGRTASSMFLYGMGDTMEYINPQGLFTSGRIKEVDYRSGHYIVENDQSFEVDFVPFNVHTASDTDFVSESEDASADDNFEFEPETHSEDAYTSNDSGSDDNYSQNMTDVSGFESMNEFDQNFGEGGEDKVEASNEEGTESGLDDILKSDNMGDSMYDNAEEETNQVGEVVEAAFDFDLEQIYNGLDDLYQPVEDEQESIDHYGFDQEFYTKAELEDGLDDTEQLDMNLQDEQGEEDIMFEEADDMQESVGDVVNDPELNYSETNEVQRDQMARKNKKDLWLI